LGGSILRTQRDRWLAAGAIWGPGLLIIAWVVGGLMVDGYSPVEDHISDLAAVDAPSRVVMNIGFAAFGVGVGTSAWPLRRFIGKPAALALGINAALVLGVILTPAGRSSATDVLHGGLAIFSYLSLTMVTPLAAWTFRRRGLTNWAIASLVVGLITAFCLWVSLLDTTSSGLFQRIGLTTTDLWLMVLGIAFVTGRFWSDKKVAAHLSPQ